MNAISALVLLFSLYHVSLSEAFSTYLVEERAEVCFFQYVESKTALHAKVFVFEGGAKMDIGFSVRGPMQLDANGEVKTNRGKLSVRHFAKVSSEGFVGDKEAAEFSGYEHEFDADVGEYEICLTNDRRFEQVAKHVMLDISEVVEDQVGSPAQHSADSQDPKQKDLVEIKKGMGALRDIFEKIENSQDEERRRLVQRKMAAENNHSSMVQSSVVETAVLLIVGVGQIFFVRKWFSGKGNILKQWA